MTQEIALFVTLSGVIATVLLMFLPAITELKRPHDAGPRLIVENFSASALTVAAKPASPQIVMDIEGEARIIMTYARFLRFLPNLESAFPE